MTIAEIAMQCGFETLVQGDERTAAGVFCGDLLSWAMGRAKEDDVWCTVMGNINTIAVAALADCACIVLCHDAVLDENAKERAAQQGIAVYATAMPEFEASFAVGKAMGL